MTATPDLLDVCPPARPAADPADALDELARMAERGYNQLRYGGATTGVNTLRKIHERAADHARHLREDRERTRA